MPDRVQSAEEGAVDLVNEKALSSYYLRSKEEGEELTFSSACELWFWKEKMLRGPLNAVPWMIVIC